MTLTLTQRETALARANTVRLGFAAVRREVAAGVLEVNDAIRDPRAERMTIGAVLMAQRQWGPRRASERLGRLNIGEHRKCGDLTIRQRDEIVTEVSR